MRLFKSGDAVTTPLKIITLIGIAVLAARFLMATNRFHSGLLYIAWPFGLSLALYYLTPQLDGTSWKRRFWNNVRGSMIIMFASSLILMEGYVCVVMFLPIYFLGVLVAFLSYYLYHRFSRNSVNSYVVPAIVLMLSLEGVTDATTFSRTNEVSHSQIVQADIATIRARLARPPEPAGDRHWMLSIFPMPQTIGTVEIRPGAVRTYEFVYHRWFATNTHRGQIRVTFDEVEANRIRTTIDDTSYISGYMKLHGSELMLQSVGEGQTRVTLTVTYDRMLDPAWYFGPLERFAVRKSEQFFITALLGRGAAAEPAGKALG